jgi:hypothetical protein
MIPVPLSTIVALARTGALEYAWQQFSAAGFDRRDDDPAALNVKGRLLKDQAMLASGEERRRLYVESAGAYRRSAELQPGTYPLINAASLSLLAGDRAQAAEIASEVIGRIERERDEPETPYWRGATVAEALLLLGRLGEAKAALGEALAAAPRAWEDHASTLRQLILIHEALDADASWLDLLRPPRSLHYSGRIGLSEQAAAEAAAAAAELIASERIGFGYGALAAGADIIVAEALLSAGAELHVVLPSDPDSFARRSVEPYGPNWRSRFDAVLSAADTAYSVRPLQVEPDSASIGLADQIAAGMARLNAERLLGAAAELVVGSPRPGRRTADYVIDVVDEAERSAAGKPLAYGPPVLALVSIDVGPAENPGYAERTAILRETLGAIAAEIDPHLVGDRIIVGIASVKEAVEASRNVRMRLGAGVRIAGHFGLVPLARDPFLERPRPTRSGSAILEAIAQAAPPDTICVSLDFAAALAATAAGQSGAHWIGELNAFDGGSLIPLYVLGQQVSDD